MPRLITDERWLLLEDRSVGGSADVAHKDLDDSPRKMVLRNKPIQLSSAVLDMGSGGQVDGHSVQCKEEPSMKVLNLTANSRLSGDGSLPPHRRYSSFSHPLSLVAEICELQL